jgi:hypothetical protein
MNKKKWIQEAGDHRHRGALHSQLGVSQEERIPKTLLQKIKSAKIGSHIKNPTKTGTRRIAVTSLLKKRANFALNVGYGRYPRRR